MAMIRTYSAAAVAAELLKRPLDLQWGMQLRDALRMSPGTLYPILARFREAGWVTDEWETKEAARATHAGAPRRYYVVTTLGLTELAAYVAAWDARGRR